MAVRGDIHDVIAHELERPFGDPSCSVAAVDGLPEWENLVVREIVLQLLSCHEHDVQELLHLRVAGLGLGDYLADKVHWTCKLSQRGTR
jgi:hypothetical protein